VKPALCLSNQQHLFEDIDSMLQQKEKDFPTILLHVVEMLSAFLKEIDEAKAEHRQGCYFVIANE
jgi:hypothetical protein